MIILITSSLLLAALTLSPAKPSYVITGQVQDNAGKAACGVRVCAFAADFDPKKPNVSIPCALSDARGQFSIAASKPGKYRLFYDHAAHGYWSPYLPFFRHPSSSAPEILLDDTNVRGSVMISLLPKNGLLTGKSVDAATGLPVESVEFILCHAANAEICWRTSAKSSDGAFAVPAPHVPFTIRIRAEGFEDWLGTGEEKNETPISIAPETKVELTAFLKRVEAWEGKALSDAEKQAGVHLPAPVQLAPADAAVFTHYPRLTKLEWLPAEGAASYTVEVDYCAGGRGATSGCVNPQPLRLKSMSPTSGIVSTGYEFNFIGAQPGRWRVWAVDEKGREGFKSPWRGFVYLR